MGKGLFLVSSLIIVLMTSCKSDYYAIRKHKEFIIHNSWRMIYEFQYDSLPLVNKGGIDLKKDSLGQLIWTKIEFERYHTTDTIIINFFEKRRHLFWKDYHMMLFNGNKLPDTLDHYKIKVIRKKKLILQRKRMNYLWNEYLPFESDTAFLNLNRFVVFLFDYEVNVKENNHLVLKRTSGSKPKLYEYYEFEIIENAL